MLSGRILNRLWYMADCAKKSIGRGGFYQIGNFSVVSKRALFGFEFGFWIGKVLSYLERQCPGWIITHDCTT